MNRNETIKTIRDALKRRTGKPWSVTGGRGTAYGWITIDAPPARRTAHHVLVDATSGRNEYQDLGKPGGHMTPADRAELAAALGLESVHFQGVSIASSNDHYREYIDRAEGLTPTKIAQPYWD